MGTPRDTDASGSEARGVGTGAAPDNALCVRPCQGTGVLFFSVLPPPGARDVPASVAGEEAAVPQDPYSWHGGAAVGAAGKWTLQVFCEIPSGIRGDAALVDAFLRDRFRQLAPCEQ